MTDEAPLRRPRFHGRVEQPVPLRCSGAGCTEPGEFRAPLSNRQPGSVGGWQWLCLDHVRAFNATYNFFDGLSPDDIAAAQSPLAGWTNSADPARAAHDPARAAHNPARAAHDPTIRFNDPLGALRGRYGEAAPGRAANGQMLSDADLRALKTLGLTPAATRAELSRAYKTLVRRYHPDSNGGDRSTERQLQDVVQAYTHLKSTRAFARTPKEP